MIYKELYRIIKSSDFADNIHIPLELQKACKSFSVANESATVSINITINGKVIPVPPKRGIKEVPFERYWFTEIDIDCTDLGHNFVLAVFHD
jgi:hypothetical protein